MPRLLFAMIFLIAGLAIAQSTEAVVKFKNGEALKDGTCRSRCCAVGGMSWCSQIAPNIAAKAPDVVLPEPLFQGLKSATSVK